MGSGTGEIGGYIVDDPARAHPRRPGAVPEGRREEGGEERTRAHPRAPTIPVPSASLPHASAGPDEDPGGGVPASPGVDGPASGRRTVNRAPPSGAVPTSIRPPWRSTMP